jgi:hypothetical protein
MPGHPRDKAVQPLPGGEALSFLKEIKRAVTWKVRYLAKSLNISIPEAKQVRAAMEFTSICRARRQNEKMADH